LVMICDGSSSDSRLDRQQMNRTLIKAQPTNAKRLLVGRDFETLRLTLTIGRHSKSAAALNRQIVRGLTHYDSEEAVHTPWRAP